MQRTYLAIDLKSYYASAECAARHLDPLTTNLVVADSSRTEKTICLAVSPSLKAYGIPGRARLFEVVQKVKEINAIRLREAVRLRKAVYKDGKPSFSSTSYDSLSLAADPSLELSYLVAPPRMAYYEKVSRQIYGIYLKYIAPEDIVVYSIDEVFIDATSYLSHYNMTAHDLVMTMIREVLYTTGITATAGIGTNLYLAKLAMDITAKHAAPDKDGVRIAELDEESFRYLLWDHKPLTDFWMTGPGTVKRLEKHGIHTMGELAYFSTVNQDILYKEFGADAELLIDHAWGLEPCGMKEIKAYKPSTNSISEGQVLSCPYPYDKARIIVMEMADSLVLQLTDKGLEAPVGEILELARRIIRCEVLDEPLYNYTPKTTSNKDAMDYDANGGRLMQVEGKVTDVTYSVGGKGVSRITLKDGNGDFAEILIEDGIVSGADWVNDLASRVKKGRTVRAIGLLHLDSDGTPVLRVRNCDEVVYVPPVPVSLGSRRNPRTGDLIWIAVGVMVLSGIGLAVLLRKRKR